MNEAMEYRKKFPPMERIEPSVEEVQTTGNKESWTFNWTE
jgi:hypothetical protein